MKETTIDSQIVQVWVSSGEVLSSDKNYETHVTSSGGGGYVDKHGGYVASPRVSSYSVEKHEFWIREEDGIERSYWLNNAGISLRPGQAVSVILVQRPDAASAHIAAIVNHSAANWNRVTHIKQLAANLRLISKPFHVPVGLFGAALFSLGFFALGNTPFIAIGFAAMCYTAYKTYSIFTKWPAIFNSLDRVVQQEAMKELSKPRVSASAKEACSA